MSSLVNQHPKLGGISMIKPRRVKIEVRAENSDDKLKEENIWDDDSVDS